MSYPYTAYHGYQAGWPGYGASYSSYDYNYYQQQQYGADYAAWYAQQQQQQVPLPADAQGDVAPPRPPAAAPPPLPSDDPPPLPDDPPPPGDVVQPAAGTVTAKSTAEQQADTSNAVDSTQYQEQYASYYQNGQYDAYAKHPAGYTGYGSSYAGPGQPTYPNYHSTGYFAPSSTNTYASQVQATANGDSATADTASAWASAVPVANHVANDRKDFSRVPPPASLAATSSITARSIPGLGVHGSTAVTGSNASPLGGGNSDAAKQPSSLEAMKAAALAVASRLTQLKPAGKPQYIQAQVKSPANGSTQQQDAAKELPISLQQYVARALAVLGKTDESRLELRTVLRDMIAKAKRDGTMWSTDWDREPLPALSSQAASAAGSQAQHQEQRGGNVFDRLGGKERDRQGWDKEDEYRSRWSSRKRGRDGQQYSDGSHSSEEQDDDWQSYTPRKKKLDLHGNKKQQGKQKGKKGKQKQQQQQHWDDEWNADEQAKHAARSARFAGDNANQHSSTFAAYGWDEADAAADAAAAGQFIVGTCQTLEKRYFRLTKAPQPSEVRPQPVLQKALQRLVGMIARKEDKYLYYNDQFKAMRQDLTVQGIKNDFTVQVYEAHARAALEYGDNAEYNQCQTQLAILYAAGLPGSHAEFGAYRLLYQCVHAAAGEGRRLLGTMKQLLGNKVGQVADSPEVQHAMQVRPALASLNVARFFRLYACAPRLGRCLMDVAVKQLRWKALNTLVRAHKPGTLPLSFLATALGFLLPVDQQEDKQKQQSSPGSGSVFRITRQLAALTVDENGQLLSGCSEGSCIGENAPAVEEQDGLQACLEWCKRHGAVFDSETDLSSCCLLTKDCWQKLFIPEDTTKVAHGDVNLDIRDFLAF